MLMFMSGSNLKPSGLKRRLPGAKGGDLAAATDGLGALRADDWNSFAALREAMRSDSDADLGASLGNGYRASNCGRRRHGFRAAEDDRRTSQLKLFRDRDRARRRGGGGGVLCLQANCEKLWPIAGRDADNQPGRPYACLRIEGASTDGKWRYRLDASHDVAGLEEPK